MFERRVILQRIKPFEGSNLKMKLNEEKEEEKTETCTNFNR